MVVLPGDGAVTCRTPTAALHGTSSIGCRAPIVSNLLAIGAQQPGSDLDPLEELGHERRDGRPLGAGQRDVCEQRVPLERLDDCGDAVVPADPEVVPLRHVVREDDARALPDPRQDREEHVALERLRLVDDHEGVVQGPAPDVGEREDLEDVAVHDLLDDLLADQGTERVEDGLRPGVHLLGLAPGQVAELLAADRVERAEHHHLAVLSTFEDRLETCAQRQGRLAGAGPPAERDDADLRVEQESDLPRSGPPGATSTPIAGLSSPVSRSASAIDSCSQSVAICCSVTSSSSIPVKPESTASSARYSSARRPTAEAFTRIGRSLDTTVTSAPAAARFAATARMRVSLSPSRNPSGSTPGSVRPSSTRSEPPSVPSGIGQSRPPWAIRRSSSSRRADRAK